MHNMYEFFFTEIEKGLYIEYKVYYINIISFRINCVCLCAGVSEINKPNACVTHT